MNDPAGDCLVRSAKVTDLAAVVALENRCFSDPWSPAALLGELVTDRLRLPLVVEVEDRLCGYLMAWRVVDQLHILNIAMAPEYQRRGLATRLLREAARQGIARGLVEFTLEVRRSNSVARKFYAGHGFAETGVRQGYYADNAEDAIIMNCPLALVLGAE